MPHSNPVPDPKPLPTEAEILALAGVSLATLEGYIDRLRTMLSGIAGDEKIASILMAHGYTDAAHAKAWVVFDSVSNRQLPVVSGDSGIGKAFAAIDRWDEAGFRLVRAALKWDFPAVYEWLVDGIAAHEGHPDQSAVDTHQLLLRLTTLETGKREGGNPTEDAAAVAAVAELGLDRKKRAELLDLCNITRGLPSALPGAMSAAAKAQAADEARRSRLLQLVVARNFVEKWTEVSNVWLTSRRHRITLGIAKLRKSEKRKNAVPAPLPGDQAKPK